MVLEIAFSCLADKCVDLDRYGIVRGRVANKCEGRPLSLPLYLFFCGVAFCQGKKPSCLPDRSVSPSQRLMWLQGLSMGKETRALSEDPVLHLLSPLSWSLCWKPVSSGVRKKESSVCFCSPLNSVGSHNLHYCLNSHLNSETLLAWRVHQKQDCQGVTSKLAKAHTHIHTAIDTNHIEMIDYRAQNKRQTRY